MNRKWGKPWGGGLQTFSVDRKSRALVAMQNNRSVKHRSPLKYTIHAIVLQNGGKCTGSRKSSTWDFDDLLDLHKLPIISRHQLYTSTIHFATIYRECHIGSLLHMASDVDGWPVILLN